ncbi:olfactory receptor 52E8-like [Melanerpes formicivorus]|uniref:olfactory receptor 52E8-like n=1 Tax=Melanerpes formicivorus TaxID=211600 RepID=UPI00358E4D11
MQELNESSFDPITFVLTGIPGLEESHIWISVPFCLLYLVALLANTVLLLAISTQSSLQQPMHLLLAMLALADLLLSTSTVPKMLALFWFSSREISFDACITQMFFTHFSFILESSTLLAMAFDRYVAVCEPLRYAAILSPSLVLKVALSSVLRAFLIMFPPVFLLKRLPYCGHKLMPHTYCEHMGIARLACADIRANVWYGLATALLSSGLDVVLISVSYALILRAALGLPSPRARLKALGTCGSHLCAILAFYLPAFFSFLAHRFGRRVPAGLHVLLANLYVVLPPVLNPIVYGVRSRQIRQGVLRLLRPGQGWPGARGGEEEAGRGEGGGSFPDPVWCFQTDPSHSPCGARASGRAPARCGRMPVAGRMLPFSLSALERSPRGPPRISRPAPNHAPAARHHEYLYRPDEY